ncbi:DUF2771 family protein [Epidermidibacterium keratini]|uniref:DUF2771 family protein n=1 Tax=Epidermidibacterium keratini TaxID=1891644 RepID=A0A7L4YPQ5_9ACTN|nr:DUF2771 family protein [Epidermidibacterium keratini]QHC01136.1 DUF2771 family protein [Epidermidibacterium keratini]
MKSRRITGTLLALLTLLLSACSNAETAIPKVSIEIGNQTSEITPTVYCVSGEAKLGESSEAMQVSPNENVTVTVPDAVAEKQWSIQIWSVADNNGTAVPGTPIGEVPAGSQKASFNTSDSALDRYFIVVAIPEEAGCNAKGAAGMWTLMVSRVG